MNRFGFSLNPVLWCLDHQQGLLAIVSSTNRIYIYGKQHVQSVIVPDCSTIVHIALCAAYLIVIDSRNTVLSYPLMKHRDLSKPAATYFLKQKVTCTVTDPTIDWVFFGMSDGSVVPWDVTRHCLGKFKVPNLYVPRHEEWRMMGYSYAPVPGKLSPVVSVQIHPKDLGVILIAYPDGVVLYSIRTDEVIRFYELEYAPGSTAAVLSPHNYRRPIVKGIEWSPWGDHFVSYYTDSTFAFWDVDQEYPVQVRNFVDSNIHTYTPMQRNPPKTELEPIRSMRWCCCEDPTVSFILMLGGLPKEAPVKGISLFSYRNLPAKKDVETFAEFFANPNSQRFFPFIDIPPVRDMLVIPSSSPHYNGSHNPKNLLLLSEDNSLSLLDISTGNISNMSLSIPPSLCFLASDFRVIAFQTVTKKVWNQIEDTISVNSHYSCLFGGSPSPGYLKKLDERNLLITSTGLSLSIWDISQGFMNPSLCVNLDFSSVMRKHLTPSAFITTASFSTYNPEFSCADSFGRVIVCKRKNHKENLPAQLANGIYRLDDTLVLEGTLHAQYYIDLKRGRVTLNQMSNIGFVCIGYQDGGITIIDMRGPHILCNTSISELGLERRGKPDLDFLTSAEFVVMNPKGSPSSIYVVTGTYRGMTLLFRIDPSSSGRFSAYFESSRQLDIKNIYKICSLTQDGQIATATGSSLQSVGYPLPQEVFLVYIGDSGISVFNKINNQVGNLDWRKPVCCRAALVLSTVSKHMGSVVCVNSDLSVNWYSLPNLREERKMQLPLDIDKNRLKEGDILGNGDYIFPTLGAHELAFGCVLGSGRTLANLAPMMLITHNASHVPPRPSKSLWNWLLGEQSTSAEELDILLGGENRAESKVHTLETPKVISARPAESVKQPLTPVPSMTSQSAQSYIPPRRQQQQKGFFAQINDHLAQRGNMLGGIENTMDDLEEMSAEWANEIKDSLAGTKKDLILSGLKSYIP